MTKKNLRDEFFGHESKMPPNYEKDDSQGCAPNPEERELVRQRVLDHLESAIWGLNDLTAAARFADRQKYTEIVGQLTLIVQKFTEIGAKP